MVLLVYYTYTLPISIYTRGIPVNTSAQHMSYLIESKLQNTKDLIRVSAREVYTCSNLRFDISNSNNATVI